MSTITNIESLYDDRRVALTTYDHDERTAHIAKARSAAAADPATLDGAVVEMVGTQAAKKGYTKEK